MKKIFLTLLVFLVFNNSYAKQWIIFYADNSSLTGHAFVSFIREEPLLRQTLVKDCWGFYPERGIGVFGDVPGEIRDDWKRQRTLGFMLAVSDAEFNKCLSIRDKWHRKRYSLTKNNCIDFLRDIAGQIPRINLAGQGRYTLPIDFIRQLKASNRRLEFTNDFGYPFTTPKTLSAAPRLLPRFSFALTKMDRGEIVLQGKFAKNIIVTLLTPNSEPLNTQTGKDSWVGNIANSDFVTRFVRQPAKKQNEISAFQSVAIMNSDNTPSIKLIPDHSVTDAAISAKLIAIAKKSGLLKALLRENAGSLDKGLLSTYEELALKNKPVIKQLEVNGRSLHVLSYHIDQNTTGPQVLIENEKAYPLTGQCSQPVFLSFAVGSQLFIRAGSFCCECGINSDQIFEIVPNGVKKVLIDNGRSD